MYYVVHTKHMDGDEGREAGAKSLAAGFGAVIRARREQLRAAGDQSFSVRQVAGRIGVEPSFLSKVERGEAQPPSELRIRALADELGLDPDVLLALAGKVSSDLLDVIRRRPELFGALLRSLRDLPDHAVVRLVREVRDGDW